MYPIQNAVYDVILTLFFFALFFFFFFFFKFGVGTRQQGNHDTTPADVQLQIARVDSHQVGCCFLVLVHGTHL
jgi:hypothetical protein